MAFCLIEISFKRIIVTSSITFISHRCTDLEIVYNYNISVILQEVPFSISFIEAACYPL